MKKTVRLGFELGTGNPVDIPVDRHMVVCGQTQQSGKTTTLEALVERSGVRALAFLTKRGERGFSAGSKAGPPVRGFDMAMPHTIPPYFRERADWQFVSAILEASLGERMKFERSWIMRAARGAKTLADVRRNVDKLGAKTKGGMSADMYMMLGEYLDAVVPQLDGLPPCDRVRLAAGLNVANLVALSVEVQGLVISSMLSWVHDREEGVVCVVPESWKFIPQGRNSPVRMAAISLAREGAGIGNRLWIDSQDIAGAEKEVVRQCTVWLMGVQREANEIKRTLDHIPAGIKKPKAQDIATLERGQFIACWGQSAIRTYVWPSWLAESDARAAAVSGDPAPVPALMSFAVEDLDPAPLLATARTEKLPDRWPAVTGVPELDGLMASAPRPFDDTPTQEENDMKPEEMKQFAKLVGEAVGERVDSLGDLVRSHVDRLLDTTLGRPGPPKSATVEAQQERARLAATARSTPRAIATTSPPDEDALYARFLLRLRQEDPQVLLKVAAQHPELRIEVERPVLRLDGASLRGRISQILAHGFFKEARDGSAVLAELARRGGGMGDRANYARELAWLTANGFLFREGDTWIATGQKVVVEQK